MSKARTIGTRVVAVIGILLSFSVMRSGIHDLNEATLWLQIFRGLFWLFIGAVGLLLFVEDFKEKKWPLES